MLPVGCQEGTETACQQSVAVHQGDAMPHVCPMSGGGEGIEQFNKKGVQREGISQKNSKLKSNKTALWHPKILQILSGFYRGPTLSEHWGCEMAFAV